MGRKNLQRGGWRCGKHTDDGFARVVAPAGVAVLVSVPTVRAPERNGSNARAVPLADVAPHHRELVARVR